MPTPPAKRQKRSKDEAQTQKQEEGNDETKMPKKRFFRQRAHANPFSDHMLK